MYSIVIESEVEHSSPKIISALYSPAVLISKTDDDSPSITSLFKYQICSAVGNLESNTRVSPKQSAFPPSIVTSSPRFPPKSKLPPSKNTAASKRVSPSSAMTSLIV